MGGTAFDGGTYRRYIELLDTDATTVLKVLSDTSGSDDENLVEHAEFELLRQGGCGAGRLQLSSTFDDTTITVGQFVRMSYSPGNAWYLGRVEEVEAESPSGVSVQLYGPISMLSDTTLGGYGPFDVRGPHLYAQSDYFVLDPNRAEQSWDTATSYTEVVELFYLQYILPATGLALGTIEAPAVEPDFTSLKFEGDTSLSEALRSLAEIQYGASYGVNADGQFFFIQNDTTTLQATYQDGLDIIRLSRATDRSLLYNRVALIGGYVYVSEGYGHYRFRAYKEDSASVAIHGQRPAQVYLPWIRDNYAAEAWFTQFLSRYGTPRTRYTFTTEGQGALITPWGGQVRLNDKDGSELVTDNFDTLKVEFNEVPRFTITTGPEELQYPPAPVVHGGELPQSSGSGPVWGSGDESDTATLPDPTPEDPVPERWEGILAEDIEPAANAFRGATTAVVKLLARDADGTGLLALSGDTLVATNRSKDLEGTAGTYVVGVRLNGENRIVWIDCGDEGGYGI